VSTGAELGQYILQTHYPKNSEHSMGLNPPNVIRLCPLGTSVTEPEHGVTLLVGLRRFTIRCTLFYIAYPDSLTVASVWSAKVLDVVLQAYTSVNYRLRAEALSLRPRIASEQGCRWSCVVQNNTRSPTAKTENALRLLPTSTLAVAASDCAVRWEISYAKYAYILVSRHQRRQRHANHKFHSF